MHVCLLLLMCVCLCHFSSRVRAAAPPGVCGRPVFSRCVCVCVCVCGYVQVWKKIIGESATEEDLAAVDLMIVESMQKLRTVETLGVDADSFNDIFMETFTTTSLDGR